MAELGQAMLYFALSVLVAVPLVIGITAFVIMRRNKPRVREDFKITTRMGDPDDHV